MKWLTARMVLGIALMGIAFIALIAPREIPRAIAQDEKPQKKAPADEKDDPKEGGDKDFKAAKEFGKVGPQQCKSCHNVSSREDEDKAKKLDTFIWLKEYGFWLKNDMHRYAYNCLSDPLGKQMANLLKYDVTKAEQCLVCHAVDLNHSGLDLKTPLKTEENRFFTNFGMSCEACHGISTKYVGAEPKGWKLEHAEPEWRDKSPDYKKKYNMLDMRNPIDRAEKCASCHVGNSKEGKVVTHDIFAAGHPPLQPLEIVNFAEQEPAHWNAGRKNEFLISLARGDQSFNFLDDLAKGPLDKKRQKEIAAANYYYIDGESKDVRDLVVGMVATLRSNVKLIREESAKNEPLDFTHFDCNACHHDLKIPSGRQVRGYDAPPGRPIAKPWTNEILKTMVLVWIKEKKSKISSLQFESELRKFNVAMTAKPFGDLTSLKTATASFEGVLKTILDEMSIIKVDEPLFDKAFVEALYKELRGKLSPKGPTSSTPYIDYEVAQLYGWTLKTLTSEAKILGVNVGDGDVVVNKFEKLDPNSKDAIPDLLIQLRQGSKENSIVPIADRLAPRMKSVGKFDSLGFRKLFD